MTSRLVKQVVAALGGVKSDAEVRGQKGVFIFETRAHPQMPALLRQCRRLLPSWKVIVVHGPEGLAPCAGDRDLARDLRSGLIKSCRIPARVASLEDYNQMMTSPDVYARLPFEHILVAQTDSMLCSGALKTVDSFLDYDYVGAPWPYRLERLERGGNGGLSLRKRSAMIRFTQLVPRGPKQPEDVYFSTPSKACPLHIAPNDVAAAFSVEHIITDAPVGTHKPWLYLDGGELQSLSCSCPGLSQLMENNGEKAAKQAGRMVEVVSGAAVAPRVAPVARPRPLQFAAGSARAMGDGGAGIAMLEGEPAPVVSTAMGGGCARPAASRSLALAAKLGLSRGGKK